MSFRNDDTQYQTFLPFPLMSHAILPSRHHLPVEFCTGAATNFTMTTHRQVQQYNQFEFVSYAGPNPREMITSIEINFFQEIRMLRLVTPDCDSGPGTFFTKIT
jgi:hypothetical protein